jgi:beta-aspartyl-peptidase (threonine type)
MKLATQIILAGLTLGFAMTDATAQPAPWAMAIHGGAGTISRDEPAAEIAARREALTAALEAGRKILEEGGQALDCVETVIRLLEDRPEFNAGRGAVYTHDGSHQLDASIMDGRTLAGGAVANVSTVANPISLARLVMEKSRHVLLMGEGAEQFAVEMGIPPVGQEYFHTDHRYRQLQEALENDDYGLVGKIEWKYGTVGCVVLDTHGNLAAGTSTGGMTNKRFGRVGDSPVVGAGNYADNRSCAISCTGTGEVFLQHTVARSVAAMMQYGEQSLERAAKTMIHDELSKGDGGLIAVSKDGVIVMEYNSEGMYRGAADSSGRFDIAIWDE